MSLRTTLGLSWDSSLEEGTPDEVMAKKRRALDERLRPARLEAARRNSKWTELEEVDLVPRGRGWFVHAESDKIYTPVRGMVFAAYSVSAIADQTELAYYVDRSDELHFFERVTNAPTWTEFLERKAARELRKAAPRPRRGR